MALKTRIVIFRNDRRNDVFVLKDKNLTDKMFQHKGHTYFINDKHFQLTTRRLWWSLWMLPGYCTTYYYSEGKTNPVAVPSFDGLVVKSGIEGEELTAIFTAWLYRIIAAPTRDLFAQLQFYINVGTLLGVIYLIWMLQTGDSPLPAPPGAEP